MKKGLLCSIVSLGILMAPTTTAFAGTWQYNKYKYGGYEWQYLKDNGAYAEHEWIYDNGSWYYIGINKAMCTKISIKSGNDEYYVGADGKMIKSGFIQINQYTRYFADKDGKLLGGLFMVDGVLYESDKDNKLLGISINYPGKIGVIKPNGKEMTINCIFDNGKVLDENGQPFTEDSDFLRYVQYIPKYDSKGNLIGAIDNGHKVVPAGCY